jgi:hypothetical protein
MKTRPPAQKPVARRAVPHPDAGGGGGARADRRRAHWRQCVNRRSHPRRWRPFCPGTAAPIPPRWRMRWLSLRVPEQSARTAVAAPRIWAAGPVETPARLRAAPPCDARQSPFRANARRHWTIGAAVEAARDKSPHRPRSQTQRCPWSVPCEGVTPASAPESRTHLRPPASCRLFPSSLILRLVGRPAQNCQYKAQKRRRAGRMPAVQRRAAR